MPEKNTRQELIEKFLTGYKVTREDWAKLLMSYALVEEAAKNTTPATGEEVLGGSDNEKFITSFLLDYFWKQKILGNSGMELRYPTIAALSNRMSDIIQNSSTTDTETWSSQKIKQYVDASEAGMLTYKGQVANIAALNAITEKKVGDTYNVLGDGNGANFTWNGTALDELGMHILVDGSPTQNSKNPVSSGGVFDELGKKIDTSKIVNDLTTGGATNVASAEMVKFLMDNKLNSKTTYLGNDGNNIDIKNLSIGFYSFIIGNPATINPFLANQLPPGLKTDFNYFLTLFPGDYAHPTVKVLFSAEFYYYIYVSAEYIANSLNWKKITLT